MEPVTDRSRIGFGAHRFATRFAQLDPIFGV